ncbi:MAG TPA: HD domain-containing phosphohydrolase, partial [Elusimicrobiota bacterium]|nr:HD domain-containing phosphohydrolase [Elusimicrobiota bacterium]
RNPRLLGDLGISSPTEQQHPLVSCKMLEGIKMLEGAIPIIKHHHESFDGSGFPGKLKGEDIPLGARVLGLVEALEELRMAGLKDEELAKRAAAEAQAGKGTRFDPLVVDAAVEFLGSQGGSW